jgi:hypothetical protein
MRVRTITYCSLSYTNHLGFRWTAMYVLGGNTTRVSQTDVNFIYLFCVQEIMHEKYGSQLFAVFIPTREALESRSAHDPHSPTSRTNVFLCRVH